ncbi:MAG: ABC transporter ATP-binding protein [Planctomycetota bacterium]
MPPKNPTQKVSFSSAWREARELLAAHRARLLLGLVLMLVSRLAGLVMPGTSKLLIDEVVGKRDIDLLWPLAIAGGLATLVQAVTGYALSQVLGVAAQRAINEMRKSIHDHVLHLPVSHFNSTQSGVLISRVMNDAEGLRNLVGTGIVQLVGGLVSAGFGFAVLLYLNWKLTMVVLIVLAMFGLMMTVAFRRLRPLFRARGRITAEITGRLGQTLGGVREVKAYTAEAAEQAHFVRGVDRLFENIRSSMRGISATTSVSTAIVGVVGVLMTLLGGHAILAGEMTLGDFVMYLVFISLVVGPVVNVASIGTQISEAFAGMDRLRELREVEREDVADQARQSLPEVQGEVRFEDVSFAYEPGRPVLEGINLVARAGSTTALVGTSGGGKTTLANLVLAFHRPLSGRVLVDGRDLATLRLGDYRRHLGVVLQDNFLFDGTIAENIAFSRPRAARAEIEAVARTAHCEQFVQRFEQGYDTVVGERGVKLSGGQRQRIAIARALLADPRILVLDEATSMLDSESEALIQESLQQLRQRRTTFVIAHRLSTIRSADQILVIENGRILERGRHTELLALGGRYRELYERQHRYEENRYVNPGEDYVPEADDAPR